MFFEFVVEYILLDKDEYRGKNFDWHAMNYGVVVGLRDNFLSLFDKVRETLVCAGYFVVDFRKVCAEIAPLEEALLCDRSVYGMIIES